MAVFIEEIVFETEKGRTFDLTKKVKEIVKKSGIKNGIANVFAPHATGVLFLGEFEPNINEDYLNLLAKLAPEGAGWKHDLIDNNAHAHLRSMLVGTSICIPVKNSELLLGTWQRIIFVENDRDRVRRVVVSLVGE